MSANACKILVLNPDSRLQTKWKKMQKIKNKIKCMTIIGNLLGKDITLLVCATVFKMNVRIV